MSVVKIFKVMHNWKYCSFSITDAIEDHLFLPCVLKVTEDKEFLELSEGYYVSNLLKRCSINLS